MWEVKPEEGETFILHCEFQSSNDKQMLPRILLYYSLLYYQKKLPLYQYVLYVGKDKMGFPQTSGGREKVRQSSYSGFGVQILLDSYNLG